MLKRAAFSVPHPHGCSGSGTRFAFQFSMTFQELTTLIRQRWPDARVEDDCLLINVASKAGPIAVRVSYSGFRDEIGFIVDVMDAAHVPGSALASASLRHGSLVVLSGRIVIRHRDARSSFRDVDVLRLVRSLAASAAVLRKRWPLSMVAA